MLSIEDGAKRIGEAIRSNAPFFIGRHGTIELEVFRLWMAGRTDSYPLALADVIERNAGVFPKTDLSLDTWCEAYATAIGELTGAAVGWYKPLQRVEAECMKRYASGSEFHCPLRSLEPYYVSSDLCWTRELAGKRVTVVSSFADSIRKQIQGESFPGIWTGEHAGMLSGPTWSFVKTGYSPALALGRAGWPSGVKTWQDAVDYVVEEAMKTEPHMAIIGCGGLGMLIGAELKRRGVSSIILGGATQVLFGIKGKRWATHPVISGFWNSAWVWPTETETPKGASAIEGGCYW
jgi:hypothetical protein